VFIPENRRIVEKEMPHTHTHPQCLSSTLTETSYTPVIVAPSPGMAGSAWTGKSFSVKLPLKLD